MSSIETLAELFSKFPGIGPRQSRRFVYFLLRQDATFLNELAEHIRTLKDDVSTCSSCYRFFAKNKSEEARCAICRNPNRDGSSLMVVEKDVDLENIERAGAYQGYYFVLGGTVALGRQETPSLRTKELLKTAEARATEGLREIVIATSARPDGEHTAAEIRTLLAPIVKKHELSISMLGRGLSTGLELEYSDTETIKNALKNRA